MYAVIKTGGKQYKVASGDVIRVEKLAGEAGERVAFDQVFMIGDEEGATVGTPLVEGASVSAEVLAQTRGDKILVFKKKRRKGYRRMAGHRQDLTVLRITEIQPSGAKKKAAPAPTETKPAKPAKAEAEKTPAQKPAAKKKAGPTPAEKKAKAAKKTAGKQQTKPAAKKKAAAKATKEES